MASLYILKLAARPLSRTVRPDTNSGNQTGATAQAYKAADPGRAYQADQNVPDADDRMPPPPREDPYPPMGELPEKIDPSKPLHKRLDVSFPGWPIRDQGSPENCVAFSAIACFEHFLFGRGEPNKPPPDRPAYSAQFLIYMIKKHTADPHPDSGYTYLRWAYEALQNDGACREALWPYTGGIVSLAQPGTEAVADAKKFTGHVFYRDLLKNEGQMDAARLVYECLRQNQRPVAMSLPVFPCDSLSTLYQTNWTDQSAFHLGVVADPRAGMARIGEHCVCVTGFVPGQIKGNPGYFVFRNSWGTQWAQYAPGTLPGPVSPGAGYGVVSEAYVNQHCKEVLQLY